MDSVRSLFGAVGDGTPPPPSDAARGDEQQEQQHEEQRPQQQDAWAGAAIGLGGALEGARGLAQSTVDRLSGKEAERAAAAEEALAETQRQLQSAKEALDAADTARRNLEADLQGERSAREGSERAAQDLRSRLAAAEERAAAEARAASKALDDAKAAASKAAEEAAAKLEVAKSHAAAQAEAAAARHRQEADAAASAAAARESSLQASLQEARGHVAALTARVGELEQNAAASQEGLVAERDEARRECDSLRAGLEQVSQELEAHRKAASEAAEAARAAASEASEELAREREKSADLTATMGREREAAEAEAQRYQRERAEAEASLLERAEAEARRYEGELGVARGERDAARSDAADTKARLDAATAQFAETEAGLRSELAESRANGERLQGELAGSRAEGQRLSAEGEALRGRLRDTQESLSKTEGLLRQEVDTTARLRREIEDEDRVTMLSHAPRFYAAVPRLADERARLVARLAAQRTVGAAEGRVRDAREAALLARAREAEERAHVAEGGPQAAEIAELRALATDLYQEVTEQLGVATVAKIRLAQECRAHQLTKEELADTASYYQRFYENLAEELHDRVTALEDALAEATAERDELAERQLMNEQELEEMGRDLEVAWEFSGRQGLATAGSGGGGLSRGAAAAGEVRGAGGRGARGGGGGGGAGGPPLPPDHPTAKELHAVIADLQQRLAEQTGQSLMDRLRAHWHQQRLEIVQDELKDSVEHMQSYFGGEHEALRRLLVEERRLASAALETQAAGFRQQLEAAGTRIEALRDDLDEQAMLLSLERQGREQAEKENAFLQHRLREHDADARLNLDVAEAEAGVASRRQHNALGATLALRAELLQLRGQVREFRVQALQEMEQMARRVALAGLSVAEANVAAERGFYELRSESEMNESERRAGVLEAAVGQLKDALQDQMRQTSQLTAENEKLEEEADEYEREIERLEDALADLAFLAETSHVEKQGLRADLADAARVRGELEAEVERLVAEERQLKRQEAAHQVEMGELTFLLGILQDQIGTSEAAASKAIAKVAAAGAEARRARETERASVLQLDKAQLELQDLRAAAEKLRKEKVAMKKTLGVARNEAEELRQVAAGAAKGKRSGSAAGAADDESAADVAALRKQLAKLGDQFKARHAEVQELEGRVAEREDELSRLLAEMTRLTSAQITLRASLAEAQDQIQAMAEAREINEDLRLVNAAPLADQPEAPNAGAARAGAAAVPGARRASGSPPLPAAAAAPAPGASGPENKGVSSNHSTKSAGVGGGGGAGGGGGSSSSSSSNNNNAAPAAGAAAATSSKPAPRSDAAPAAAAPATSSKPAAASRPAGAGSGAAAPAAVPGAAKSAPAAAVSQSAAPSRAAVSSR